MGLQQIGSMFITIKAEGANKAEKDILNVEGAFSKTAKSVTSKTSNVEYFLKRWGVSFTAVALAAGGLYTIIKAGPVAYSYWEEFGNLMGAVSDTILTALSPAIDAVMNVMWGMESLFEKLPTSVQALVGVFGVLGGAIATIYAYLNFSAILAALWTSIQAIGAAIAGGLTAPIVALIALIVGLYFAWTNNWLGIRDIVYKVVAAISTSLTNLKDWLLKKWTEIKADVFTIWEDIKKKPGEVWDSIISGASQLYLKMKMTFNDIYTSVTNKWTELKNWILSNPIIAFINTIVNEVSSLFGGGKASGGSVMGGTPYMVGEKGPELFIPSSSGNITPNSQLGGSSGQSITLVNKVELDGRQLWESVRRYSSAELRRLGG
jgi:hypothetical protein